MRISSVFVALVLFSLSLPAFAGSVTYADMRGKWQPTGCTAPQPLADAAKDSEIQANDLNAQYAAKNKFVDDTHEYMTCVAKDAGRDAEAVGVLVTKSAQAIIDKAQADIDAALGTTKAPSASK